MFRSLHATLTLFVLVGAAHVDLGARGQVPAGQDGHADCASLTRIEIPDVRVTEAVAVAAPASGPIKVAHCKVSGVIDTEIRFTALLPAAWNERFFAGGGGGFVGTVDNMAQTSVNFGYATVGTDTGHQGRAFDAGWALQNRERLINFGYRAIHRTTEVAKMIVKAHYGRDPKYSYFFGCSNGGRQGLMEVQRYPADFDGVVSCAPALDFTSIAASFVKNIQAAFPDPRALAASAISPDNLKLLEAKILDACDLLDGVKDGVLDDPRDCRFKIADVPACPDDRAAAECVTTRQRAAIERIYAPTTAKGTGLVYPGQPFGGEAQADGWQGWITGVNPPIAALTQGQLPSLQFAFGTEFFKYIVFGRKDWDYSTYDLSSWLKDTQDVAALLNADNPDLAAFKAKGGKLVLAHGWADPALNPLSTIAYYQRLLAHDPRIGDTVRLFMMPGVLHCAGGPGPDIVDWFSTIAEWVEQGRAPERVIARKLAKDGRAVNAHPLCQYPQRAMHVGTGSTTEADSYVCRTPADGRTAKERPR